MRGESSGKGLVKGSGEGSGKGSGEGSPLQPYGFIAGFGLVSMFMDIVYEGALAVQGPLLLSLGASAVLVGIVSGLGEAASLAGRLVSGPLADRTGKYWLFAFIGYAVTALAVPAMGIAGSVGITAALIIIERLGKSIRTPSRDAMLSSASSAVGRGKGFALHEMLDQVGAVCGPLIVAAILGATGSNYAPALGVLIIPGAIAVGILLVLRKKVPDPAVYERGSEREEERSGGPAGELAGTPRGAAPIGGSAGGSMAKTADCLEVEVPGGQSVCKAPCSDAQEADRASGRDRLPRKFWMYAFACGTSLSGVATFAVMSYHMVSAGLVSTPLVPVVYAVAMGIDALAAFVTGSLYDRVGSKTLLALPVLAALIPWFAYSDSLPGVIAGVVLWGLCIGVQESTMRAQVGDLVPRDKRATAYGVFSVFTGVGTFVGATMAGLLYANVGTESIIAWAAIMQVIAFVLIALLASDNRAACD